MLQTFFTRKAFKGHSTGTPKALKGHLGTRTLEGRLGTQVIEHSKHSRHFLWQIPQNLVNVVKLLKLEIILYHTLFTSFHQSIWWLLWQCRDYCLNFYWPFSSWQVYYNQKHQKKGKPHDILICSISFQGNL